MPQLDIGRTRQAFRDRIELHRKIAERFIRADYKARQRMAEDGSAAHRAWCVMQEIEDLEREVFGNFWL